MHNVNVYNETFFGDVINSRDRKRYEKWYTKILFESYIV